MILLVVAGAMVIWATSMIGKREKWDPLV